MGVAAGIRRIWRRIFLVDSAAKADGRLKKLFRLGLASVRYLRHGVHGTLPRIIQAIFNERARLFMQIIDIEGRSA